MNPRQMTLLNSFRGREILAMMMTISSKMSHGRREATTAVSNRYCTRILTYRSSSPMPERTWRVVGVTLHIPSGLGYARSRSDRALRNAHIIQELEVRRRYSEFSSLRATLVSLHPTLIIPPIPEKHSMADYAAKPTKAKEDTGIIDLRKRMLMVFLNRCRKMKDVREDGVWWRFLDPNASWVRLHRRSCIGQG